LPHPTSKLGEVVEGNRINTMELSMPAVGPITASVDILGRAVTFAQNPGWTAPTYDDDESYAVMADPNSGVSIDGALVGANGAVLTLNNNLVQPDNMRVTGSYSPKDYPCVGRAASVRTTVFVEDYDMYMKIFAGVPMGPSMPWTARTSKGNIAITSYSPLKFASDTVQYAVQFRNGALGTENNVSWTIQPPQIQPGQPIAITLIGTLLRRAGGSPFTLRYQNDVATAYAIPS
jgi:hypothetical protein